MPAHEGTRDVTGGRAEDILQDLAEERHIAEPEEVADMGNDAQTQVAVEADRAVDQEPALGHGDGDA